MTRFWQIYLAISFKYIIPTITIFITFEAAKNNMEEPYEGYRTAIQWVGITVCIVLLFTIVGPAIFCSEPLKFEHNPDDPFDQMDTSNSSVNLSTV